MTPDNSAAGGGAFDLSFPNVQDTLNSGARIAPVMTPDASLDIYVNALPTYNESYPLTTVVAKDELFWGQTAGTNLPFRLGEGAGAPVTLAYTNATEVYASYALPTFEGLLSDPMQTMTVNNLRHYAEFRFCARSAGELVWDGSSANTMALVREAIAAGATFRATFESEEGFTFSLGVDLAMFFPESAELWINTFPVFVPGFFFEPSQSAQEFDSVMKQIEEQNRVAARLKVKFQPAFFSIRSTGQYYGLADVMSGQSKTWRGARLFAY